MITLPVPLGDRSYEVRIGLPSAAEVADALAAGIGPTTGVAMLVDAGLAARSPRVTDLQAALCARFPQIPVRRYDLPAGEASKTLAEIERTCQWLAEQGFDRGAVLVGVGGGAASDHAGFAAAIYLRGVSFAVCSTTLLGMVDASVGGKTGADLPAGKNLVGAFHQPRAVVADLGFLETLPQRELSAGMAEVVKAGFIADSRILERLDVHLAANRVFERDVLAELVALAVQVKIDVVTVDEREAGRRAILNFGHTIGHAIEAAANYELLHGEAVSLGMIAALALGEARGITPPDLRPRACALLERLGLPVDVKPRLSPEVLARIEVDKKRRSDKVRFVFVSRAGQALLQDVPLSEVKAQVSAAL